MNCSNEILMQIRYDETEHDVTFEISISELYKCTIFILNIFGFSEKQNYRVEASKIRNPITTSKQFSTTLHLKVHSKIYANQAIRKYFRS